MGAQAEAVTAPQKKQRSSRKKKKVEAKPRRRASDREVDALRNEVLGIAIAVACLAIFLALVSFVPADVAESGEAAATGRTQSNWPSRREHRKHRARYIWTRRILITDLALHPRALFSNRKRTPNSLGRCSKLSDSDFMLCNGGTPLARWSCCSRSRPWRLGWRARR